MCLAHPLDLGFIEISCQDIEHSNRVLSRTSVVLVWKFHDLDEITAFTSLHWRLSALPVVQSVLKVQNDLSVQAVLWHDLLATGIPRSLVAQTTLFLVIGNRNFSFLWFRTLANASRIVGAIHRITLWYIAPFLCFHLHIISPRLRLTVEVPLVPPIFLSVGTSGCIAPNAKVYFFGELSSSLLKCVDSLPQCSLPASLGPCGTVGVEPFSIQIVETKAQGVYGRSKFCDEELVDDTDSIGLLLELGDGLSGQSLLLFLDGIDLSKLLLTPCLRTY